LVTFETELEGTTETALARFLARARRSVGLEGRVNVLVTTNRHMRDLNRRFRRKDKPTDVLSFPAPEQLGYNLAGDIAVSADIAAQNAAALGHSIGTELKVLVLHGLLHLAGYDHESDDGDMAGRERALRRQLKLPEGLIDRVGGGDGAGQKAGPSTSRRNGSAAPLGRTDVVARATHSRRRR
jgi:probable rRNA maturation factor